RRAGGGGPKGQPIRDGRLRVPDRLGRTARRDRRGRAAAPVAPGGEGRRPPAAPPGRPGQRVGARRRRWPSPRRGRRRRVAQGPEGVGRGNRGDGAVVVSAFRRGASEPGTVVPGSDASSSPCGIVSGTAPPTERAAPFPKRFLT